VPDGGKESDLENIAVLVNQPVPANTSLERCALLLVNTKLRLKAPVELNIPVVVIPAVDDNKPVPLKVTEPLNARLNDKAAEALNRSESLNASVIEKFPVIHISAVELK
jgi:hypothetical protein